MNRTEGSRLSNTEQKFGHDIDSSFEITEGQWGSHVRHGAIKINPTTLCAMSCAFWYDYVLKVRKIAWWSGGRKWPIWSVKSNRSARRSRPWGRRVKSGSVCGRLWTGNVSFLKYLYIHITVVIQYYIMLCKHIGEIGLGILVSVWIVVMGRALFIIKHFALCSRFGSHMWTNVWMCVCGQNIKAMDAVPVHNYSTRLGKQ